MANTYKTIAQSMSTATTLTTLYTVPASTSTVASTLTVCNQGVTTNIRVAVRPAGEAINAKHYILYDVTLNANDSMFFTIGLTLATTDVVSIYAGTSTVSFNLYGSEVV